MTGFFTYYNYGGAGHDGTTRIGTGYRGVFAIIEGRHARIIDWSTGEVARVDAKEFERHATPDKPRLTVVRRALKRVGARSALAAAARKGQASVKAP